MRLWQSAEFASLSRAKGKMRSMVACSIEHFRSIKASLRKMTRSNCGQHGHVWRVKWVFELMATAPNDGHFDLHEMGIFPSFLHFAFLEISCVEAVLVND